MSAADRLSDTQERHVTPPMETRLRARIVEAADALNAVDAARTRLRPDDLTGSESGLVNGAVFALDAAAADLVRELAGLGRRTIR